MINHHGSTIDSGHYTSNGYNSNNDKWCNYNDSSL